METMTQEDKELLLKDLCARLPYGVVVKDRNGVHILTLGNTEFIDLFNGKCNIAPYLFPMSPMTHEQKKELIAYAGYERREEDVGYHSETYYYDLVGHENILYPNSDAIDWLNKNHFDYRGLIEKGLAIDATGMNIY